MVLVVGTLVGLGGYLFWYGKGYSYLSDDPVACTNCHVMRDNFTGWRVSSHRDITCDGCHLPHDLVGKYYTQAEDGFRHSAAFTFADVQVIRIRPASLEVVRQNCIGCHESSVSQIMMVPRGDTVDCTHCHHNVGHLT
jgi:cytochrome c nitrite reductase small subunit